MLLPRRAVHKVGDEIVSRCEQNTRIEIQRCRHDPTLLPQCRQRPRLLQLAELRTQRTLILVRATNRHEPLDGLLHTVLGALQQVPREVFMLDSASYASKQ